jgi:hypothetical protein
MANERATAALTPVLMPHTTPEFVCFAIIVFHLLLRNPAETPHTGQAFPP